MRVSLPVNYNLYHLYANPFYSDFNDLCCNSCQLRPANYTCRAASSECDIAEVCSGTSGNCPPDKYKDDLTSCSNGLQCASGQCTSRDQQCIARGVSYNMKKACGADNGCQVSCQDPRSALQCTIFPGAFIDGTPCGIGGICKSGKCNSENFSNNIKNWIDNHLQIVIPVAIVVGLLLLFCIFRCCCYGGRSGYNNIGKTTAYIIPAQQTNYPAQYSNTQPPYYPPPPPGTGQQYYTPPSQGWVDPALYNGNGGNRYGSPQQPLPVYSQNDPHLNTNQPHDSYELNNANNWQRSATPGSPAVPHPPSPGYQMPSPPPVNNAYPTPPPHNNNGRPYHEGVV